MTNNSTFKYLSKNLIHILEERYTCMDLCPWIRCLRRPLKMNRRSSILPPQEISFIRSYVALGHIFLKRIIRTKTKNPIKKINDKDTKNNNNLGWKKGQWVQRKKWEFRGNDFKRDRTIRRMFWISGGDHYTNTCLKQNQWNKLRNLSLPSQQITF